MDILHLATFLQGGAGRVIADLACAQAGAGHRVTVVASRTGAPANRETEKNRWRCGGSTNGAGPAVCK